MSFKENSKFLPLFFAGLAFFLAFVLVFGLSLNENDEFGGEIKINKLFKFVPDTFDNGDFFSDIKNKANDTNGISVVSFGDVMLGRGIKKVLAEGKNPFEFVNGDNGKYFQGIDVVMANLEGPITDAENCQNKPYSFKFATATAELLKENGFNALSLANNHSFDCFNQGLLDTRRYLNEKGILNFGGGISEPSAEKEIDGIETAFVGIDQTTMPIENMEYFYELVRSLKDKGKLVIVSIHWGNEYQPTPSKIQTETAHKLIDSGAGVVFGHHPHIIEPLEIYAGKVIFYSLGNFVFDQIGENENKGIAVGAVLGDKNYFRIFPYRIQDMRPMFLSAEESETFCEIFLSEISNKESCGFEI